MRRTMAMAAMDPRGDASGSEENDYSHDQEQIRTGHGFLSCSLSCRINAFLYTQCFTTPRVYESFSALHGWTERHLLLEDHWCLAQP